MLHKVERKRKDYLVVCTGHQGEPGSILERISRHNLPFKITSKDNLVFSSRQAPGSASTFPFPIEIRCPGQTYLHSK